MEAWDQRASAKKIATKYKGSVRFFNTKVNLIQRRSSEMDSCTWFFRRHGGFYGS